MELSIRRLNSRCKGVSFVVFGVSSPDRSLVSHRSDLCSARRAFRQTPVFVLALDGMYRSPRGVPVASPGDSVKVSFRLLESLDSTKEGFCRMGVRFGVRDIGVLEGVKCRRRPIRCGVSGPSRTILDKG